MKKRIYISLLMMSFCFMLWAQDNENADLGSENIIVIKEYEARIADAKKLNTQPTTQEVEVEKQKLDYDVPEKRMDLEYPAHTVRPLAMPKVKPSKYHSSYAKLGFGIHLGEKKKVYYSPFAEIVYNNNETKNLVYGAHYKHFSALAAKKATQKFRNEDAKIYAQYFIKKLELGLDVNFKQNVDFHYGYPVDTIREAKQVRQAANSYGTNFYVKNAGINKLKLDHKQHIGFNYMVDAHKSKEWYVQYKGSLTKTFKNFHYLDVNLGAHISNFIPYTKDDLEREVFQIGAAYTFNNDDWKLKGGIDFGIGEVAHNKQFDFYPIIYTEKRLYKHFLLFYTSWRRDLKINTYQTLLAANPYINLNPEIRNSRVEDRIAGFKGSVKNFTYNARFSNKVIKDMPLFVNDTLNMNRFNVIYEKILFVYNINAELGFSWTKNFKTQLTFDYRIYDALTEAAAWHLPALNTNLSASYKIQNRYFLNLEFYALAGAKARDINGDVVKLKGTADINLGFSYKYSKNLSMFIKLNNLAHSKQQRFLNYRDYGFNALLGAKFEF